MKDANRRELSERVSTAADAALEDKGAVSALDVLLRIGWLDPTTFARWERGELARLEEGIQTKPMRVAEMLEWFKRWAEDRDLEPRERVLVDRTPARRPLVYTRSGDEDLERLYRTQWISRDLPQAKCRKLESKVKRGPELVVIQPLNDAWKCHRCAGTGDLLFMENPGPACLSCAGLGSLEFLPAGNTTLTRRAKAKSRTYAVVVRFNRSRKRYERQGILVEPAALDEARGELAAG